jgi:hypothetical protein
MRIARLRIPAIVAAGVERLDQGLPCSITVSEMVQSQMKTEIESQGQDGQMDPFLNSGPMYTILLSCFCFYSSTTTFLALTPCACRSRASCT